MTPFWMGCRRWFVLGLLALGSCAVHGAERVEVTEAGVVEATDLIVAVTSTWLSDGMEPIEVGTSVNCVPGGRERLLVAALDEPMPPGTWLEVEVQGPGASRGFRAMTVRGHTLVLLVPGTSSTQLSLRYRFGHDLTASTGSFSRTILFTLLDP